VFTACHSMRNGTVLLCVGYHSKYRTRVVMFERMVISHAACVVACLVDSSFACWPFLARHSRGVRANIDLELHKLRHLQQLHLYTISCHHGPQHPQYSHHPNNAPVNTQCNMPACEVMPVMLILYRYLPIPVAARSIAWVFCGCSLDGIAGSNLSGDTDVCLL